MPSHLCQPQAGAVVAPESLAPRVPHDVWLRRFDQLLEALAGWFPRWPVDDVDGPSTRPLWAVADDLADVWRDLTEGVRGLDDGTAAAEDVIWEWRDGFETHWGQHALGALMAIHEMRFG
jgi:hypothetical protein